MLLVATLAATPAFALKNQLKNHASPYLRMHSSDPVKWQDWSPAVMQQARKENKLVFISIGYFSCHWCHVMQKESYKDKTVAAFINKHYIPVKVDRELNPTLDIKMLEFVRTTQKYSGWPLNVFVTPEGYPLVGVVYLPKKNFHSLLTQIQLRWTTDQKNLKTMALKAAKEMETPEKFLGDKLNPAQAKVFGKALIASAMKQADDLSGGFGKKTKFPHVPRLLALMDVLKQQPNKKLEEFVRLSLDQMASQGLNDQLRGGFYRYTVDTQWQTPHFEKMLYDNAQLSELYLRAAKQFKSKHYEKVARKTLDFMINELQHKSGGMMASLSALDGKGVEGGFYLWHDKELKKLLSKQELQVVKYLWGMDKAPALTQGHLPVVAHSVKEAAVKFKLPEKTIRKLQASARKKLLAQQRKRVLPVDDKILASWNGMALYSFSMASQLPNSKRYRVAADRIHHYLTKRLWDGKQLHRARRSKKFIGSSSLEDYAMVAKGILQYAHVSRNSQDIQLTQKLLAQGWKRYFDKTKGWQRSQNLVVEYGGHEAILSDSAIASPSSVLIQVSLDLAKPTKDKALMKKAKYALNVAHKTLEGEPLWFGTQIRAWLMVE